MAAKKKAAKAAKDLGSGKPRHEKLGVKPGQSVALVGKPEIGNDLSLLGAKRAKSASGADWVLISIESTADLPRIAETRSAMGDESAIWAVWPKGRKEISEQHIRDTALAIDLVDVKVMKWSETHSGLKLVVRKERRGK